jgi:uncharacterized membrane protein YccC
MVYRSKAAVAWRGVDVKLWSEISGWAGAHMVAFRLCLRMTIAGFLAYVLAHVFALSQGYWAVFSAIIVVQASLGGSVRAALDRLIGTVGGGVAGGLVGYVLPHQDVVSLGIALIVALVPLTLVAALWPNYRIAPLTAVVVLLTSGVQQLGPVDSALNRIIEIALGSSIALGVSLLILPARAHGLVINAASRALNLLADLLMNWLAGLAATGDSRATRITQLQDEVRAGMARLEAVAGEAHEERRTHLTQEFDPKPLVRTIFRLRNDVVMIGRAAGEPFPQPIVGRLEKQLDQVSQTAQHFLRSSAQALCDRNNPPPLDLVEQALAQYTSHIGDLRREGAIRALSAEQIGRLFALEFALGQLQQDFREFHSRVAECTGSLK